MKLFIAGGAGFIGSNFIRYIQNTHKTYAIVNVDKLTYAGNLSNLKDLKEGRKYTFVKADICNSRLMQKITKKQDVIINFAAQTHVDRSINDSTEFTKTNVLGTHVLLDCVRKNKIKRFIQISTDEVYGSVSRGFSSEASRLYPNSPYSSSKASADLLCRSYFMTFGTPVVITRSCNNFGPYQNPEKVIPLFITNLLGNKKVPLYGDGLNVREWIYVVDNCRAIDLVLHKAKTGETYNIGSGKLLANIELTKLILEYLNKSFDSVKFVKDRLGHDRRYALDSKKLIELGFRQKHNFYESLGMTINWYKNNKKWWHRLIKY